jgi:cellulose synthase operon protein C
MPTSSSRVRSKLTVALLCAFGTGCATVLGNRVGDARTDLAQGKASPRQVALVGLAELDRGHSREAQELAQKARASAPNDEVVLLLWLLLADRDLDSAGEEASAMALLRNHPASSFARLASVSLARLAGQSTRLDQILSHDLPTVLSSDSLDPESRVRLTEALAAIAVSDGDHDRAAELRRQLGLLSSYAVVGPFSPFHYLEFDHPFAPESDPVGDGYGTPWGAESWRAMRFANGLLPLGHALAGFDPPGEENRARPPSGDLFYARLELEAGDAGLLLCVESTASVRVLVDGRPVLTRDLFRRSLPRAQWLVVPASRGKHQVLLKASAGEATHGLRIYARPLQQTVILPLDGPELATAMTGVVGEKLAHVLASRAIADIDPHAALALLPSEDLGTLALSVRSELWGALDTLGDEDARARAERDLDGLLTLDPGDLPARLRRAQLLSDSGRVEAAAHDFLGAGPSKPSASWLTAQARLRLSHDAAPLALAPLLLALTADPGDCQALELTLSLYDQMNAFSRADQLAESYVRCPGGQLALAQRRSMHQGPQILVRYWSGRLDRSPSDPDAAVQLAEALMAQDRPAAADAVLLQELAAWPEDLVVLRRLGQMRDLSGQRARAREAFTRLLALDGADLQLRRNLALLDGRDVLDSLPTVQSVLAGSLWVGTSKSSQATFLDSGAAAIHLDGSVTERVRSLQRPLDEAGVTELGELELPPGATLVALRTHKRDGRVFDAEAQGSGEKKTISVASLSVGDDLETDYLLATPPSRRGAGGSADGFFFQASDSSLQRSYYLVHSDGPAVVDAHRVEESPPQFPGDWSHDAKLVPALPAEPQSVPPTEFMPWVQVGTGDTATDLARSVADGLLPKQMADETLRQLVTPLRRISDPAARADALWGLLSQSIRGDSGSLSEPVSEIMSRGSGNLLLPMKSGLEVLGITSHIILVNGPTASIEPRRFPQLTEYTDSLLAIDVPGRPPLYLATSLRYAPFGRAPPALCGRLALEVPNGDEPGRTYTLPPCPPPSAGQSLDVHRLAFTLRLGGQGAIEGEAEERFEGFTASSFRSSLEQLDEVQRRQGVESALASVFRGVELSDLSFVAAPHPGAPLVVTYRFKAPDYATPELGERTTGPGMLWSSPLRGFPAKLGERYVQLASRKTALLIGQDDHSILDLHLFMPPKAIHEGTLAGPLSLETPFGVFRRIESATGAAEINLHEELVLPAQRVSPAAYPAFASFAAQVDEAQSRHLRYRLDESKQASGDLRMQIEPRIGESEPVLVERQIGIGSFPSPSRQ